MDSSAEQLIARISGLGGQRGVGGDRQSLLHAYVACLSFAELCDAIIALLEATGDVRLALRGRMVRLLTNDSGGDNQVGALVALVDQTALAASSDSRVREVVDALHSALLPWLPPLVHREVLDRWANRGNRRSMARWLKATKERPETFDANVAFRYWRATRDPRAAKSIAYQADLDVLREMVGELIRDCEEGWIIARAVIRLGGADCESWDLIWSKHPASYLYICARLDRNVTPEEAYELVCRCGGIAADGNRGLAIWAVGQMGMLSTLERIEASLDLFEEQDIAAARAKLQGFAGPYM